jgi:molecular chaperone HtpG
LFLIEQFRDQELLSDLRVLAETKPILEINPTHPLVEKLKTKVDENLVNVLFDQAVLSEGGQLKDPAEFVKRMNKLIN